MADLDAASDETLVYHVAPRAVRRSRWFSYLLVFNWGFLGYLMYTFGSTSRGMFFACFVAGLLCFGTAIGQFRAIRLSQIQPLIRLEGDRLIYRYYSSRVEREIELSEVAQLDTTVPGVLDFLMSDQTSVLVRLSELTPEDRESLMTALSARLRNVAS